MTYNELRAMPLEMHKKVKVIIGDDYRFTSTYKWCVGVYTENFCKYHNITFEVLDD